MHLAGAILDRGPIDEPGSAGVFDDPAKVLVFALPVLDQVAGDELVLELSQREREALCLVLRDDGVGLLNYGQGRLVELRLDEGFVAHGAPPS